MLALALACGPRPAVGDAAEPPTIPESFAEVAATALAASFVIRASGDDTVAEDSLSIHSALDAADDIQEDGWEPLDPVAVLRNRTLGAGVIIDPRGIALTSTRVMLRASAFEVVLMDGTPVNATVVGLDLRSDVAVLRLESRGGVFPHLPLGDSERMQVGDWVISVGAPLGLEGTVAAGVITATPMPASPSPFGSYLQSDAAMARGNAGGPLVNMSGELIGLGTVVAGDGGAYAIPSKTLRRIALDLLEKGRVSRPWLGTTTQSLNAALARAFGVRNDAGALIADVVRGGPGAAAGLRPGDIVVGIGTTPISSRLQFERAVSALAPGGVVTLKLRRDGHPLVVPATLGEEPDGIPLQPDAALAKRRLGIEVRPVNPATGAVARDIALWSSAARAGIKSGDVIREVNGRPIRSPADFQAVARTVNPGAPVLMRVQRGDVVLYVVINAAR
jgi:S1-C subfamily serine protease